ncbi:unnamed protein product [Musa textilis]
MPHINPNYVLTTKLKTFSKLIQNPESQDFSGELSANFLWSSDKPSDTILRTPSKLLDFSMELLASSDELLRKAPIFLDELRELPSNLSANFRKPFGKLPTHSRSVLTALRRIFGLPSNSRTPNDFIVLDSGTLLCFMSSSLS